MNCPYCKAVNDPASQFCMVCGKPLTQANPQPSARGVLWIVTGRIFIMLLFLWVMRVVVNGLTYVQATTIPEINLEIASAINLFVFFAVVVLLVGFITAVARLWPPAFPRFQEAAVIINTILYLIIFNQVYLACQQIVPTLVTGVQQTSEIMMMIGVALVVISLVIIIRTFIITYQVLPRWLSAIQFNLPEYPAS